MRAIRLLVDRHEEVSASTVVPALEVPLSSVTRCSQQRLCKPCNACLTLAHAAQDSRVSAPLRPRLPGPGGYTDDM